MNSDTLKQYYDLLEDTLKELNLHNSPSQLYNVDESSIPLDPKALKAVTTRNKEGTVPIPRQKRTNHSCCLW